MVTVAMGASDILSASGIEVSVLNARFIKPLDKDLILSSARSGLPIFTVEENAVLGGFGDAICELLLDNGLDNQVVRFGIPDRFVSHGRRDQLLEEIGLSPESIASKVMGILHWDSTKDRGGLV
jgi:1-deoxy-D-xylulose-5-phosphate synthase